MESVRQKKVLNVPQKTAFEVVSNIQAYPEFLPWCVGVRYVKGSSKDNTFQAEMRVGFSALRESFITQVTVDPCESVDMALISGPFRHLKGTWSFLPLSDTQTEVSLSLDFEFKSFILQKTMSFVFKEAVQKMMSAFEKRALQKAV